MDGKTLLQVALERLDPNQANQIVESSGLRFQVQGQWVSWKEGMLRDDSGNPVMAGAGAITAVALKGEEGGGVARQGPVTGALTSGVNAPVFHRKDAVKAVAGAPFQAPDAQPAGPQLGLAGVTGPQVQKKAEQNQGQEGKKEDANLAAEAVKARAKDEAQERLQAGPGLGQKR